jgi:hypothetical protein
MSKQGLTGLFVALGLLLGNAGCGDDDSGNNQPMTPSNNGGGDNNNTGGDNNPGGDNNNTGGDNTGGDNTGGGDNTNTGGDNGNTGGGGFDFDLSCDDSIPTTATCGGVQCPTPPGAGAPLCMVPCCVEDQCGTRSANALMPTSCRVTAKTDDSCPPYEATVQGTSVNLPGCCTPEGKCGVISSLTMMCITSSPLLPDLPADPAPCTPK